MTDSKKIGPPATPAVADWDLPDVGGADDSPARPDNSFNDDRVGAHIKNRESAEKRQISDRFAKEAPYRVQTAQQRVVEAGAFRPAQEDDEARRADRRSRTLPRGRNKRVPRPVARTMAGGTEPDVQRVEDKIEALWGDLEALEDQLADWEDDDSAEQQKSQGSEQNEANEKSGQDEKTELAAAVAERIRLQNRLLRLETAAKQQLQLLLAGGVGLSLLGDPHLTFKRLFDRIVKWPRRVAPGRRPQTPEEFDTLVAYIFEPPVKAHDIGYW